MKLSVCDLNIDKNVSVVIFRVDSSKSKKCICDDDSLTSNFLNSVVIPFSFSFR
jgi:hypothetical protein